MKIKTIVDEDFTNYKVPVMHIGTVQCGGKCCLEANIPLSVCINDEWRLTATIEMDDDDIIKRYLNNSITQGICFGGLEPFEQFEEVYTIIKKLRTEYGCDDDVVIYTGYYKSEILSMIEKLRPLKNIVIKYGRYIPGDGKHFDDVLGVALASSNQYAERIS